MILKVSNNNSSSLNTKALGELWASEQPSQQASG